MEAACPTWLLDSGAGIGPFLRLSILAGEFRFVVLVGEFDTFGWRARPSRRAIFVSSLLMVILFDEFRIVDQRGHLLSQPRIFLELRGFESLPQILDHALSGRHAGVCHDDHAEPDHQWFVSFVSRKFSDPRYVKFFSSCFKLRTIMIIAAVVRYCGSMPRKYSAGISPDGFFKTLRRFPIACGLLERSVGLIERWTGRDVSDELISYKDIATGRGPRFLPRTHGRASIPRGPHQ